MAVVRVLWWFGLVCWSVAAVWHFTRPPSLWLLDVVVQPLTVVLYVFGFGAVVVGLVAGRRRRMLLTLVPVMVVVTAMVNPAWQVAPRTWFAMHRPLFDMALATEPGNLYYGNALPLPLRFRCNHPAASTSTEWCAAIPSTSVTAGGCVGWTTPGGDYWR